MSSISSYRPLFDPAASKQRVNKVGVTRRADETPEGGYVYDARTALRSLVNVALATGRPLLIRGKPGTGKSSLASDVAARLGWRYYQLVVTSRTRGRDLLWSYDSVRRLNDASAHIRCAIHSRISILVCFGGHFLRTLL